MILLLDNNQFRRRSIYLTIYSKKYLVSEQTITDSEYYTKPFMTVYINPTSTELSKIKNENTVCVVAKNNVSVPLQKWMRLIPLDNTTTMKIIKLYNELCPYGKGREIFGIVCMEGNLIALGGAYIRLSYRQRLLIRFLLYNSGKTFNLYDISNYFDFKTDNEIGFDKMVLEINRKCVKRRRELLIKREKDAYSINPSVMVN